MRRLLPLLLAAALALGGCVEAEETWTFDARGGGTYQLVLRWDADLWRRVRDVLGGAVMGRLAGRRLPLDAATWRDSLAGLEGVEVVRAEDGEGEGGLRQVELEVRFRHLRDLLAWEWVVGRTIVVAADPEPAAGGAPSARSVRLHMEPLRSVPVLDRVAALLDAVERPPPRAEGAAAERDPGPLGRFGIDRRAGELVWAMAKPALERVSLSVTVVPPGELLEQAGRPPSGDGREASFGWDFADLRDARSPRTADLRWALRSLDRPPAVDHRVP